MDVDILTIVVRKLREDKLFPIQEIVSHVLNQVRGIVEEVRALTSIVWMIDVE